MGDKARNRSRSEAAGTRILLRPVGFWSYARQDETLDKKLSAFRHLLIQELQQQYGRDTVQLFQDVSTIDHGAAWETEIRRAIDQSNFFVPIITPNFVQSEWCIKEVRLFWERERALRATYPDIPKSSRIFPIYFIDVDDIDPEDEEVLAELHKLQWFDFRRLRFRSLEDVPVREAIATLARSIRRLLMVKVAPAPRAPIGAEISTPTEPVNDAASPGKGHDKEAAPNESANADDIQADPPTVVASGDEDPIVPKKPNLELQAAQPLGAPHRSLRAGDVLNGIFKVTRFIAKGGMGEVFEGVNINTDERVAIKVMLPEKASDPKIVAMFKKEANTLTRFRHDALVGYRVLAEEQSLSLLYIVTEYIEGTSLADMLGKVERTPEELAGLLRRLASGLAAAHRFGAIHRDMSPDNVLLPGGDVHEAKIIDFGIAKDLDPAAPTVIGKQFAGKLNYVAPEQLGEYDGHIGPWTDIYSLALVILAVANGSHPDMGGAYVDAVRKRQKGPDLSAVAQEIRPVLFAMLAPDPKVRPQSMREVIAMLDDPSPVASSGDDEPEISIPPPPPFPYVIVLSVTGLIALTLVAWLLLKPAPDTRQQSSNAVESNGIVQAESNMATLTLSPAQPDRSWLNGRWCADGDPNTAFTLSGSGNELVTALSDGRRDSETIRTITDNRIVTESATFVRDPDRATVTVTENVGEGYSYQMQRCR